MSIQDELRGRVAIVTGASRGIGRAIAERLAAAGATVVIGARSLDNASRAQGTVNETAAAINGRGGRAFAFRLDLDDPSSREDFVARAIEVTGGIDILVNNGATSIYKKTLDMTLEEATGQISSYVIAPWHMCKLVIPSMIKRERGWIVNLGSSTATSGYDQFGQRWGDDTLYAALKAAIHRFSLGLGAELREHNISVNVLAPVGAVRTPGVEALDILSMHDVDISEPVEHIAEAAVDILSRDPTIFTGQIAFSHRYLKKIGRSTMSVDGQQVVTKRDISPEVLPAAN